MTNLNDTSLEVIDNGILAKILNFLKKIFRKNEVKYISSSNNETKNNNRNDSSFFKEIKFEEDPDKVMLLKIQNDFEKKGINKENAYELTKDLTDVQKQKLENLYREQIKEFETNIRNYKNKILAIRNRL